MKKLLYILLAASMATGVSCSDLLENNSYEEDVDKKDMMQTVSEAEGVLYGTYRFMLQDGIYGYYLSMLFPAGTDISESEGGGTVSPRTIPSNYHTTTTTEVAGAWQALFAAIYSASDFIETITDRATGWNQNDQAWAEVYKAEAKVLRAMYYFEALRWYGRVPLMKTTADSNKELSEYAPADPAEVFGFIETDLLEAAAVLPWSADYDRMFRMSRGSALGLLAKVYATWAGYPVRDATKWAKCAAAAALVVESDKHSLLPDFLTLWTNSANSRWDYHESLIEMSSFAPVMTGNNRLDPVGRVGKFIGVSVSAEGSSGNSNATIKTVFTFLDKWVKLNTPDTVDLRLPISIVNFKWNYDENVKNSGIYTFEKRKYVNPYTPHTTNKTRDYQNSFTPGKWNTQEMVEPANRLYDKDKSNINWYVLRYADVLLLYAEALNESGGDMTKAYWAINQVRRRGFGQPVDVASALADYNATKIDALYGLGTEKANFRQAVRDERAWELCYEGHRRQDLIRWGIYLQTVQDTRYALEMWWNDDRNPQPNYSTTTGLYTTAKNVLMPIPQTQLDRMGGYNGVNNPGW